ncbi:MAG: DUF4349 domain-containing protein [Solobacterium sp.]|nr:DUF4349 domain-containing protein [Solobacterium sp.]
MKKTLKFLTAAALAFGLAACGAKSASSDSYGGSAPAEAAYSTNYYAAGGIAEDTAYEAKQEYDAEESAREAGITGEKLVYTGSLSIETLGYEDTVRAVRERISSYKGIIENENEWDNNSQWYYTTESYSRRHLNLTVRIPTEHFSEFLNDMEGAGKVTNRSSSVENITKQYNDNSVEIIALEKQETRLLEMMDKAQTIEEMIAVETRLSEVQVRLNQKKSWQSSMDTDVMYSTVYLSVTEVREYTPQETGMQTSNFGGRIKSALTWSGTFFVWLVQSIILTLIRFLPAAVLIGALIALLRWIFRKTGFSFRPFGRKKKESKAILGNAPEHKE